MTAVTTAGRRRDPAVLARRLLAALTGTVTVSILAALVAVGVLLVAIGQNPFAVYGALVEGSLTGRGLVTTLQRSVPLVGLSIALIYSFRAGVFNLGGQGQFLVGGLASVVTALALPGTGIAGIVVACAAGVAAGAAWGVVPGVIQVTLGPPVLVTSLLLNYIGIAGVSYIISLLKPPASSEQATPTIAEDLKIGALVPAQSDLGAAMGQALERNDVLLLAVRGLNWSFVVVILLVIATILFNRRTATGFEAGVTGLNGAFARNVGIRGSRIVLTSLAISGGLAGLIGALVVLGTNYRLLDGQFEATGYAMTAILVVLLGRSSPLGAVLAGFFFSMLQVGGEELNRTFALSPAIASIIQALVIFFVVLRLGIPFVTQRLRKRAEAAATGERIEEVPDAVPGPRDNSTVKEG